MTEPPDDEQPGWRAIQLEIERALSEAGLGDGDLDEAVMDGVRQALDALAQAGVELTEHGGEEAVGPDVTVVEGGRSADEPPAPGAPPPLRVAEPVADGVDEPPASTPNVRVSVRRLDGSGRLEQVGVGARRAGGVAIGRNGVIDVQAGETQTLFRGASARPYRLFCSRGALRVHLDGMPVEPLRKGQSIDVEAALVRVEGTGDGGGGHYRRLTGGVA